MEPDSISAVNEECQRDDWKTDRYTPPTPVTAPAEIDVLPSQFLSFLDAFLKPFGEFRKQAKP